MTDVMTTKKPGKQKASPPFPGELIDQLLATVQNKDVESILGESGLAGQLKKMLAKRMLSAELTHHLAHEEQASKNHRNGTSPKTVLALGGELQLDVPRDWLSSFEPRLVAKHQLVKNRGHFPSDEAATKLLFLALRNIEKNWKMPPQTWKQAANQFAIMFGERFTNAIN